MSFRDKTHLYLQIRNQRRDSKTHQEQVGQDEGSQGIGDLLCLLVSPLFLLPTLVDRRGEERRVGKREGERREEEKRKEERRGEGRR